ncbi:MAG: chemotaxis protein CheW [Gemmatimonadota bacterium]
MEALLFTVDERRCAIPLARVAEVVPAVNVQAVPDSPDILEGVVNVRGEILPVLSLRSRLGFAPRAVASTEYLIIVHAASRRVLFRSDTAPEIAALPEPDAIDPAFEGMDRALAGVIPLPDGLALLQDVDAFMATVGSAALAAADAEHAAHA